MIFIICCYKIGQFSIGIIWTLQTLMGSMQLRIFKIGNTLYKRAYFLYRPLYFFYKRWSDRETIAFIKSKLKPGMTVLDIGANIGFYTRLFGDLVGPSGRVIAFEPDKTNLRHLRDLVTNCANVEIVAAAVGEHDGTIKLYHSNDLNVDHQTFDIGENRLYRNVPVVTIDSHLRQEQQVDLVKIDVQGYDFHAIRGMSQIIERSHEMLILGELWPYGLKQARTSGQEYLNFLKNAGFKIHFPNQTFNLDQFHRFETDPNFYTDFIATK